jgi:hypothetical protein
VLLSCRRCARKSGALACGRSHVWGRRSVGVEIPGLIWLVDDSKSDLLHVLCNVHNIGELDIELGRAETAGADRF